MPLLDLFYSVFWVSFISIIWFFTDTLLHYLQLTGLFDTFRYQFNTYVSKNQDKYLPDFLYVQSLRTPGKVSKFLLKMLSCPFCTTFWLSLAAALVCQNLLLLAPIYVLSMFVVLSTKKLA